MAKKSLEKKVQKFDGHGRGNKGTVRPNLGTARPFYFFLLLNSFYFFNVIICFLSVGAK